jgi:hypothetical protein
MPYVRAKQIKGCTYYYLCESYWADGKPRQRVIAYLGKFSTVEAAHRHWNEQAQTAPDAAARKHAREMVKKLKPYL